MSKRYAADFCRVNNGTYTHSVQPSEHFEQFGLRQFEEQGVEQEFSEHKIFTDFC